MNGWAEIVYGRTRTADFWWRTVPAGVDRRGWLGSVVASVLSGGTNLELRPRFVLARGAVGTVVGVGCRARRLSDTMFTDGSRQLFCFVGWLHPPTDGPVVVPDLTELEREYVGWAGPVYERWVTPVWEEHPSRLREPVAGGLADIPWAGPIEADGHSDRSSASSWAPTPARPGVVRLHPADRRASVWAELAGISEPVWLTTGWPTMRDALVGGVTDVCADDVTADTPASVQLPEPPRVEPPPLTSARKPTDPSRAQRELHRDRDPRRPGAGAPNEVKPDELESNQSRASPRDWARNVVSSISRGWSVPGWPEPHGPVADAAGADPHTDEFQPPVGSTPIRTVDLARGPHRLLPPDLEPAEPEPAPRTSFSELIGRSTEQSTSDDTADRDKAIDDEF